jgi:hypothetical protein
LTRLDYRNAAKFGIMADAIKFIPKGEFADEQLLETLKQNGLIEAQPTP